MTKKHYPIDFNPHGEMSYDYLAYGNVYKNAVNILLKEFDKDKSGDCDHDYAILPLLFLFRHYIEIELTGLVLYKSTFSTVEGEDKVAEEMRKTHDIFKLWNRLKEIEQDMEVPKDIQWFISNLNKMDKKGASFRYPEDRSGVRHDRMSISGKFYKEVTTYPSLKNWIKKVTLFLDGVKGWYDCKQE